MLRRQKRGFKLKVAVMLFHNQTLTTGVLLKLVVGLSLHLLFHNQTLTNRGAFEATVVGLSLHLRSHHVQEVDARLKVVGDLRRATVVDGADCRGGAARTFVTNGSNAPYFQGVETQALFNTRGQVDMSSTCTGQADMSSACTGRLTECYPRSSS